MSFRNEIQQTASEKRSNIVLALDFPFEKLKNRKKLFSRAAQTLEAVSPYICAVKFNRHLLIPLGAFDGIQKLVKKSHEHGLRTIVDCKINDIGHTNKVITQYYYAAGFDALTANPFVGWKEGLEPVFEAAHNLRRGIILLVYMSHGGSPEGYGQTIIDPRNQGKMPQYTSFANKALKWNADGVVVGATYPERIREIHATIGDKIPIYSPGIGFQGGKIEAALKSGARYLIVGRSITLSKNPAETAKKIRTLSNQCLNAS